MFFNVKVFKIKYCIVWPLYVYNVLEIDECSSDPCHNGGICKDKINAFECECKSGYSGDRCEKGQILFSYKLSCTVF